MYPIAYEADFNPTPNRATTFFRLILAIPWLVVGLFWALLFAFTHLFAWVALVVLGRYPQWLYNFNSGVVRFGMRFTGWFYLQSDVWPPFTLEDDPSYPVRVNFAPAAERQSRLKALFRPILAIPVGFVVAYGTRVVLGALGLIAWVTIVFRGYMPEWVHATLTHVNSFDARVLGYIAFLTDDYPPIGLERAKSAEAQPTSSPGAPGAPV